MQRQLLTTAIAVTLIMLGSVSSAAAATPPFELLVERDRLFGSSKGTLVFAADAVEYRTTKADDARRWTYDAVKQLQVLSPTRVAVLTYEDRGHLTLGADRTFHFKVVHGTVPPELVTFLLERTERPVVTSVMPEYSGEPLFRERVKHQQHGRGSEGSLALYEKQLLYLTERDDDSRFWRFGDIANVLRLDRFRLQVTAYEGGGGNTRTFVFELKSDLPDGFYDALWARVNPSGLELTRPATANLTAAGRE